MWHGGERGSAVQYITSAACESAFAGRFSLTLRILPTGAQQAHAVAPKLHKQEKPRRKGGGKDELDSSVLWQQRFVAGVFYVVVPYPAPFQTTPLKQQMGRQSTYPYRFAERSEASSKA